MNRYVIANQFFRLLAPFIRKQTSFFLCGFILLCGAGVATADQFGDYGYTTNGNAVIITNYTGPGGAIFIPVSINGLPVTTIGPYSFYNRTALLTVSIPNGITSIAGHAFENCTGLTNLTTPSGLISIGEYAYSNCCLLRSLTLPGSLVNIGTGAFELCYSITTVTLPDGMTNVPNWAFYRCAGITNLLIPRGVTSIGASSFAYCSGLKQIALPNTVTNIEAAAFSCCLQLATVTMPSVRTVGNSAFASCPALNGVYFIASPPSVVGTNVFDGDNYAAVYHSAGTQGWGPTFGGRPTSTWNTLVEDFGIQTNRCNFKITGPTNLAVVVEACSDLHNPIWSPIQTNLLAGGFFSFTDTNSTKNYRGRFYRIRSQQPVGELETTIWRQPPLMIDSFYNYGADWTGASLSNQFSTASSSGLSSMWDIWYLIDDGWQGGITNGILMPNLSKFNITNIVQHAHANGVKILLYVEPTTISSAGFPSLSTTNWEPNARVWNAWGIDGVKIDMTAPISADFSDKLRIFSGLVADARQGYVKPLAIFTGAWRDAVSQPGTSNFFGEQVTGIANATRIVTDNNGGWSAFCTDYVTAYERNKTLSRPGHWLHLDHAADFDSSAGWNGTNVSRGTISTFAMFSVPMAVPLIGDPVNDPTRYYELSRPGIVKLHQDPAFAPATRIYSNVVGSVWVRPLSWDAKAVLFLNHQDGAVYATNVNWVDIGFQSNQLCGVYDAWNGVVATNTYGKFTATVSNMSAFAYFIYPTNSSN